MCVVLRKVWRLVESSPLIDIILCICIDMRLRMSKGLTHGDRPCWDRVMLIIWARGDRPCEWLVMIISWTRGDRPCWGLFDFMIVRWDRQHRHMEIVRVGRWTSRVFHGSELSMYFRGVSFIYGWESTGYSETHNFIVSYCITSHDILHSWWMCVFTGGWKVLDVWLPLFDETRLVIVI